MDYNNTDSSFSEKNGFVFYFFLLPRWKQAEKYLKVMAMYVVGIRKTEHIFRFCGHTLWEKKQVFVFVTFLEKLISLLLQETAINMQGLRSF